jgi:hypothetical protein
MHTFVTKQFVFDQRFRNGRAIDGDEWFVTTVGQVMDGTANNSFPVPDSPSNKTVASV